MKTPIARWLTAAAVAAAWLAVQTVPAARQGPPPPPPPPPPPGATTTVVMGAGGTMTFGTSTATPNLGAVPQSGTGVLGGRVVDAVTNRPVPNAIVAFGRGFGAPPGLPAAPAATGSGTPAARPPVPRVLTDADGRFVFRNLPAGSFILTATRPGFADGAYGRVRPAGPMQSLALADGETRTDVTVRLFRHGAITGMVHDDLGEPATGVQVRAYRRGFVAGVERLTLMSQTALADDRGMYRIGGLTPGDYVVCALFTTATAAVGYASTPDLQATIMAPGSSGYSLSSTGTRVQGSDRFLIQPSFGQLAAGVDGTGRPMAYANVCHSDERSPSNATPVPVAPGAERAGIDLVVRLVPAASVSGTVTTPDGPAANYVLHLVPSDAGSLSVDPAVATSITAADGAFLFLGVPAGQYVIQTVRVPRVGAPVGPRAGGVPPPPAPVAGGRSSAFVPLPTEPTLWTATPVSVGSTDVTNVSIALARGAMVSGRVEFDGSAEPPVPDAISRIAIAVEPADGKPRANAAAGRVSPDARFSTMGFPAGRYLLRVIGNPPGWTVRSVMAGGVDILDTPLELSGNDVTNVVITFSDRATRLSGRVAGANTTDDDAPAVIVFPADTEAWRLYGTTPLRMRLQRASATGEFTFGALPAGAYYLAAIDEAAAGDWQDPRFLALVARQARRVTLDEGAEVSEQIERLNVRPSGGESPLAGASAQPSHVTARQSPFFINRRAAGGRDEPSGPFVPDESDAPAQMPVRDVSLLPPIGTASISGTVLLDEASGGPVRRARVTVRSGDSGFDRSTMTDEEGRWRIDGLPAGRYTVLATKPGYLATYFGSARQGRGPGSSVSVAEGTHAGSLAMRMARGAVIAGTVTDDTGQPLPGLLVAVHSIVTTGAERRLMAASTSSIGFPGLRTDDRGGYRVYGLEPGTYYVSATLQPGSGEIRPPSAEELRLLDQAAPRGAPAPSTAAASGLTSGPAFKPMGGRPVGFAPIYHPSAVRVDEAAAITVAAGQEALGIDIHVRPVPTAAVRGRVATAAGQAPGFAALTLATLETGGISTGGVSQRSMSVQADGTFEVANLVPGRYALWARGTPASGAPGLRPPTAQLPLFAELMVELGGDDVEGVVLTLGEGASVRGRVVFEGDSTPPDATTLRLFLTATARDRQGASGSVSPGADGTFVLPNVTPGEYRLSAGSSTGRATTAGGPRWGLRAARLGDRDLVDDPVTIAAGEDLDGLVVVFTDRLPELSGTITDRAGRPVTDLTIVLFSTNRTDWRPNSRRVQAPAQPDTAGRFVFVSLAPGEYYLAAVVRAESEELGDPAFLEAVAAGAIRVSIGEGERKVQDIRLSGGR